MAIRRPSGRRKFLFLPCSGSGKDLCGAGRIFETPQGGSSAAELLFLPIMNAVPHRQACLNGVLSGCTINGMAHAPSAW
jgi:hypothetical protein